MVSLRKRLILVPAVIVTVLIAMAMVAMAHQARYRVEVERDSSVELADQLLREAVANFSPRTGDPIEAVAELVRTLPTLRHVRMFVLPQQEGKLAEFRANGGEDEQEPPVWFIRLLRPASWEKSYYVAYGGRVYGSVLLVADPNDEIAELWDEMRVIAGLLTALTVTFIGLVVWIVGKALRPIRLLSGGLDRLEQGDFAASLPPFGVVELTSVGEKFNSLASSLLRMSRDNRLLIDKLISIQETERRELAHELHDELGPCLFGIKAQAACIGRPARGTPEEEHAKTILALVDDVQRLNRRILGRLLPASLDLGLGVAVGQLIEDWRGRSPDVHWRLAVAEIEAPVDHALALTMYRVVQECLTNAARHAGASEVAVEIESGPAGGFGMNWPGGNSATVAYVAIRDNGRGFQPGFRHGFGLLGIHQRVQSCGGMVKLSTGETGGSLIEVLLPLETALEKAA